MQYAFLNVLQATELDVFVRHIYDHCLFSAAMCSLRRPASDLTRVRCTRHVYGRRFFHMHNVGQSHDTESPSCFTQPCVANVSYTHHYNLFVSITHNVCNTLDTLYSACNTLNTLCIICNTLDALLYFL